MGRYCVLVHTNGIIPTEEDDNGHERLPRNLNKNIRQHESFPGVCLCRAFADFVESTLSDEVGHDLLDKLSKNGEEHEDGEHLVLQALLGERCFVEDEADEEGLCIVSTTVG